MKKVMISVAPVAATDALINPRAIARDVVECYRHGAAMVHLHARDLCGRLTPDLSLLEETVDYIRAECDIIIEISTGGVSNLTIEERCQPCYAPFVEATSLNVGSVNLGESVYQNPIRDVRFCVEQIISNHKIPEIEVFEVGMIHTVRQLAEHYDFVRPILFALVLGHEGAMPRTLAALSTMIAGVYENFPNREEVLWGITEAHREDFELIKKALDLGASTVRIGFEDSNYLRPGVQVDNNAAMIAELSAVLHAKGMAPMTPAEARDMLCIPPLAGVR